MGHVRQVRIKGIRRYTLIKRAETGPICVLSQSLSHRSYSMLFSVSYPFLFSNRCACKVLTPS